MAWQIPKVFKISFSEKLSKEEQFASIFGRWQRRGLVYCEKNELVFEKNTAVALIAVCRLQP